MSNLNTRLANLEARKSKLERALSKVSSQISKVEAKIAESQSTSDSLGFISFSAKDEGNSLSISDIRPPYYVEPKEVFYAGSIYVQDGTNDTIDPVAQAAYNAEVDFVYDFRKDLVDRTDAFLKAQGSASQKNIQATYINDIINQWATHGNLLGDHPKSVGWHKTAETLGTICHALLKISHVKRPTAATLKYLGKVSRNIMGAYTTSVIGPTSKENNHRYWDGASVALAGIVCDDQELFDWGMVGLQLAIDQVDANGFLPHELGRGSKAYHYHLYALKAIVILAKLAELNSSKTTIKPYTDNNNALKRLAEAFFAETQDLNKLDIFSTKTNPHRENDFAWLELYPHRTPEMDTVLQQMRDAKGGKLADTNMGGNVTLIWT